MQKRRPGAKALVIFGGKFVMVQRDNKPDILNPNKWNLPGGAIEEGESPREALVRELQEEINVLPAVVEDMGTTTYTDGGSIVYRYAVRLTSEEQTQVRLVSEGQQLAWFTLDEALVLDLSPHLRAYLNECREDILQTLEGKTVMRDFVCTVHST